VNLSNAIAGFVHLRAQIVASLRKTAAIFYFQLTPGDTQAWIL
jgi:hypothetical protein